MNIYEKLAKITEEIGTIPKNLTVGTGKWAYKAVAEADVLSRVKALESKYGVYSYPAARRTVIDAHTLSASDDEGGGKAKVFIRIETTYRFVNTENPEEFTEVTGYGDGVDTLDKAPGKAMTYSDKYCLLKAYKIETGDELDARASDDLEGHDIWCIKRRIEERVTALIKGGMSQEDILGGVGIGQKEYDRIMAAVNNIAVLEHRLRAL